MDAIHASAFDYLLKPYKSKELDDLMSRLRAHVVKDEKVNIEQSLRKLLIRSKFAVQTISGLVFVKCEEILLFQYLKDLRCWQMMLAADRKPYKLRMSTTAKDLLGINPSFVQISQDYIVNLDYLCLIENVTLKCELYSPFTDIELVVSQRYYRRLREVLEIF